MPAVLDGVLTEDPMIPATDTGLLRGDGAFEVVRAYGGRPFALDDHLDRLMRSCAALRLDGDARAVRADVGLLLAEAGPVDAAVRIVLTRGGRRLVVTEPLPAWGPTIALASVTYAPTRIMDGIKSLSYAPNVLATRLAREQGAEEALLVTPHGRALEAPTSALFAVVDGALATPPLAEHVLDSITRRRLLRLVDVVERPLTLEEVLGAEEAFLASTTREVQAVASVDGHALAAAPGPRTREAQRAFAAHVQDSLGP